MKTASTPTSLLADRLRAFGFVGRVVEPADPDYHRARMGWNGAIDRRPAAVAYASDADDVAAAVRTAQAAGLAPTIRAGGHSVSGRSVRDGALCIDLRALNAVAVDPTRGVVRVGGGALLSELDAATQEYGLAVPAGQISHTGVGGLTLGGGIGWLMRRHGLTIDSLQSADVVLADGQQVRASTDEHPDLFWALRGGRGDFGVVTSFEFHTHSVGPIVLAGVLVYPWEQAGNAFRASRDLMAGAPEELTIFDVLLTAPPQEPFPPELQGRRVAVVGVAWCGDLAEGERVLAPLRADCSPVVDADHPRGKDGLMKRASVPWAPVADAGAQRMNKVDVGKEAAALDEFWSQRIVGEANGCLFKVAKGIGSINWHAHDDQDEVFFVYKGRLTIQLRDRDVELNEGDMFVVPRGVEHRPKADAEVHLLLVGTEITSNEAGGKPAWSYTQQAPGAQPT